MFADSAEALAQNARMLGPARFTLESADIFWRFERTGFTTFFLFDCYLQILLLAFCWVLVLLARILSGRLRQSLLSRMYSTFHALHEITIFYLSLALVLEIYYFDPNSTTRIASLAVCVIFNLYFLGYTLWVYYSLMSYPLMQIGTP